MNRVSTVAAAMAAAATFAPSAFATDHEVRMLNCGSDGQMMVF